MLYFNSLIAYEIAPLITCQSPTSGCQRLIFNGTIELNAENVDLTFLNSIVRIQATTVRDKLYFSDISKLIPFQKLITLLLI